ncbi:helix-turn-helix transcriptional regulator [Chitinophaga sp. ARDCPP14]|uniref:helix-turn-helix transcriptional regulator n=1 Tax=Chitinophaga sp. ARDCPP14 TaxID=3391139 RepID=UPI003F51CEC7
MIRRCQVTHSADKPPVQEKQLSIGDASGFRIQLEEITFNGVDLRWGSYINHDAKVMSFHPDKKAIVSHFRIQDAGAASTHAIREKQFVVYRESPESHDLFIPPTNNKIRSFFELIVTDDFFDHIFTEESRFMERFRRYNTFNIPAPEFTAQMLPAMHSVINDMQHSPYSGALKATYLETKATELFLMQVLQLDQPSPAPAGLTPGDTERLHSIKYYIDQHYEQPLSILELARTAGINQMKLKNGFKALFNTTVFGYISGLKMQEARRLLLEEKMYVNEVADRMGYKYPQHFTAAFRKKFGLLPKDLKN